MMQEDGNKKLREIMSGVSTCVSFFLAVRNTKLRRGWDHKDKQGVHIAAVIGHLGPFEKKSEKFID